MAGEGSGGRIDHSTEYLHKSRCSYVTQREVGVDTESFSEAFNFSAILETIRSIGWGSYILALIVLWVVIIVISVIFGFVDNSPYVGWLISLFLGVPLTVFEARYMTLLYEAGEK